MKLRKATHYEFLQWLRYCRDPSDAGLTLEYIFCLTGKIDVSRLNRVLRRVIIERFSGLSNIFVYKFETLFVCTQSLPDQVLEVVDSEFELMACHLLDPCSGPLYRFQYWQRSLDTVLLKLQFSHLAFDGSCYRFFCNTLAVLWRNEQLNDEPEAVSEYQDGDRSESFWHDLLSQASLFQPLSFCYQSVNESFSAKRQALSVQKQFPAPLLRHAMMLLEDHGCTAFELLVSITAVTIAVYSYEDVNVEESLVVGYALDCRQSKEPYGCYTNLIPLWLKYRKNQTTLEVLSEVKKQWELVKPHRHFPVYKLIESLAILDDCGARPLNIVITNAEGFLPLWVPNLADFQVSWIKKPNTGCVNDLTIYYSIGEGQLQLSFDSSARYMSLEVLEAFADNFLFVAHFMIEQPYIALSNCDLSRTLEPVIIGNNGTLGMRDSVIERFIKMACQYSSKEAVRDTVSMLTYAELLEAVKKLCAHQIVQWGQTNGALGIFLSRSIAVPVAYLSAFMLQKTFTPMDPFLPDERLRDMVSAADVRLLWVDQVTAQRAARLFPRVAIVDVQFLLDEAQLSWDRQPLRCALDRTAYIMFTSGSTGKPKGVAISEQNIINFLWSMEKTLHVKASDRLVALTSFSFDISLLEILLPLMCGASVAILSDEIRLNALDLSKAINRTQATIVQATPSTWRMLKNIGWVTWGPMNMLCGGEVLDEKLAKYLLDQGLLVFNLYGPTEATVWTSCYRVTRADCVSLGCPVLNSEYYIIDEEGRSVAPGMQGELMVAGECVGQGYLNVMDSDVFFTLENGRRAYKTGDIVKYKARDCIEYVGRRDNQYKVNGYRVELIEVSYFLRKYAPSATVFTVVRRYSEPKLCCFVWLPDHDLFSCEGALKWCHQVLPYYMVPKMIYRLSTIPLTSTGKADVKFMSEAQLSSLALKDSSLTYSSIDRIDLKNYYGIKEKLVKLINNKFGICIEDFNQPLKCIIYDSVDMHLLIAELNSVFDLTLSIKDFEFLNSVNDIIDLVEKSLMFCKADCL